MFNNLDKLYIDENKMPICERLIVGMLQTNCYLYGDSSTKEIVIIDPGGNAKEIIQYVESQSYHPIGVIFTHEHWDHTKSAKKIVDHFHIPIYASKHIKKKNLKITNYLEQKKRLTIGKHILEILESPGHSPGGLIFIDYKFKNIFVGDTIFAQSIGRTDLSGGSEEVLLNSIKRNILENEEVDDSFIILTGHGPITTVENEKMRNPFLQHIL